MSALLDALNAEQQRSPTPTKTKKSNPFNDILSSILSPAVTTGKNLLGGGYEIARAAARPLTDYNKAAASKVFGGKQKNQLQELLSSFQTSQNPIYSNEDLKQLSENPREAIGNQARAGAGLVSYGIPFGKGAGLLQKVLAPGAAVGGLQAVSEKDATPTSVAGGALTGAGGAALLHGILKVPGLLGKGGEKVQQAGGAIRRGATPIELAPSVYGANREKAVQSTLDKLGITGSAQAKYEKLQPKMGELGDEISNILASNPKNIPISQVKNDFFANLQDKLITKDLTAKQAKNEINGFLIDITGSKLGSNISTPELFGLKQKINQYFQTVAKKAEMGTALNAREKVISAARQTVDDLIANAHPEVKALTTQQSHLYDAAESLAKSRGAKGLQVLGTEIPGRVTQFATDTTGNAVQKLGGIGKAGGAVSKVTGNDLLNQILFQGASRAGGLQGTGNGLEGENPQVQQNMQDQYGSNNLNQDTASVAQESNPYPIENYISDIQRDPKNAAIYKQVYDEYQKQYATPKIPAAIQGQLVAADSAMSIIDRIESEYGKIGQTSIGPLAGLLGLEKQGESVLQIGNAKSYSAAREGASRRLIKALGEVGTLSKSDIEAAVKLIPGLGDSTETAAQKLETLRALIQSGVTSINTRYQQGNPEQSDALMQYLGMNQ